MSASDLLVQKYGGSSVANVERIGAVATRIAADRAAGKSVVAVVSAMGDTTDDLLALASQVTGGVLPSAREQDALLATGEIQSAALLAMALQARGVEAVSLSGAQAGISADGTFGKGRIAAIEPKRVLCLRRFRRRLARVRWRLTNQLQRSLLLALAFKTRLGMRRACSARLLMRR